MKVFVVSRILLDDGGAPLIEELEVSRLGEKSIYVKYDPVLGEMRIMSGSDQRVESKSGIFEGWSLTRAGAEKIRRDYLVEQFQEAEQALAEAQNALELRRRALKSIGG